jgi:4-amino-4-deoxy-L-arabinose transferase-like glycosyltransferase
MAVLVSLAGFYFTSVTIPEYELGFICVFLAFTMAVTAILLARRNPQFIGILFWGMYVSLILFLSSSHWIWELNEAYPVKPVAEIIQKHTLPQQIIYTSFTYERPSLNFYSDRRVIPANQEEIKRYWQENSHPYLWLDAQTLEKLNFPSKIILGNLEYSSWTLITKKT